MQQPYIPRLVPALLAVAFSGTAAAAGFQLLEQNASGLGNSYAGSAALAENASTIFYNPAGMTQLPGRNVSAGINAIRPSFTFTDSGSTNPTALGGGAATGGNGGDAAGEWSPLPNGYLSWQLDDRWFVGVGFGAPFGLKTEYEPGWVGRFHSIKFDIKTYNINPSVAYKVNDMLSVGAGVSWQRIEAEYIKRAVVPVPNVGIFTPLATNELESDAWGWNVGATLQPRADTRFGVSYRSAIMHHAEGTQTLRDGLNVNNTAKADVKLPDTLVLSAWHQLSDRWELLADVSWTGWSSIPKLTITNGSGQSDQLTLKFRDTWRVALGANYKVSDAWKLKAGLAWDQSPVPDDAHRPASLPDNDRTWISFGVQYRPAKDSTLDVGYAHLIVKDTKINNTDNTLARGLLAGNYDSHAHIFGVQYSLAF